jgi:hypothetical protein
MLYQLPNGRTIQMSVETFLSLSDDELRDLTSCGYGREINNPLFNSSISEDKHNEEEDDEDLIDEVYIIQDISPDISHLLGETFTQDPEDEV